MKKLNYLLLVVAMVFTPLAQASITNKADRCDFYSNAENNYILPAWGLVNGTLNAAGELASTGAKVAEAASASKSAITGAALAVSVLPAGVGGFGAAGGLAGVAGVIGIFTATAELTYKAVTAPIRIACESVE